MGDRVNLEGKMKVPVSKVQGVFIMTEMYRFLMVLAAMMVCMAHGSNDVANAITPLLVV